MARIGFDLDGVTYKFVDALRTFLNTEKGIPLELMPPATRWEFYEDWGFPLEEYKKLIFEGTKMGKLFWHGEMYPGCEDVVKELYRSGHEIYFVTSRLLHREPHLAENATFYWVNNEAGLPYHKLIMSDDKFGHGLDVLFDDAPYQYEKMTKAGEKIVIFDQMWNWHLTQAERVFGWGGILSYVKDNF